MTTDTTGIILDEIALSLHKELGMKMVCRLIGVFGNAGRVFSAGRDELVDLGGIPRGVAASLLSKPHHRQAVTEMKYCRRKGIVPVGISSPLYPPLLRECCDFPVVLYTVGDPNALAGDMMAVVGTRKITPYGSVACEKLVGGLASAGYRMTIVSGLAYGVDATAHRAALANGLPTVAVLGNSLPGIYPAGNTGLARKIVERGGCLVTEYDSGAETRRSNFVARNRIIAGMSRGTLVVESPRKGGSMITAGIASGYDRLVMAVPGRITDENSFGTNFLIRSLGAVAVTCVADIAEEMELDKINPSGGKSLKVTPTAGGSGESQPEPVSVPELPPACETRPEGSHGYLPDAGNTGTRSAVEPAGGSATSGITFIDGTDRGHAGIDKESIVRQVTRMVFATQDVNNQALTGPENNTGYPATPSPENSSIHKEEQDNNLQKETIQSHNPETRVLKSSGKLPGDSQPPYPEPGVNQPYDAEPSRNQEPDDSQN
ncbi:MAG: DNA-processing protein DprA, partial [Alistipes sp.]|nr:DNA-processing protein DprA [Alistipes sp.]